MPTCLTAAIFLTMMPVAGFGQSPTPGTTFEAASMRRTGSGGGMNCNGGPGTSDPGRFVCTNAPLGMLLAIAYDVQFYQEAGPGWMNTDGYDIVAKVPPNTKRAQMKLMLQDLLAERLHLVVHRETKGARGYALTVKKGGPSVKTSSAGPTESAMVTAIVDGHRRLTATRQPIRNLAGYLSVQLGQAVLDETGLEGNYDFVLDYWPVQNSAANPDANPGLPEEVQDQLGLRLDFRTLPTEFLIVDSADKVPVEN